VCSYRRKFPNIQLRLYELAPDQQLVAFDDGRIDIGFTRKVPRDRRADFEEENIYTDELGVALP
jgi:DNA-binding transcriptional LysR family regulator